jgi:hypothetical protein
MSAAAGAGHAHGVSHSKEEELTMLTQNRARSALLLSAAALAAALPAAATATVGVVAPSSYSSTGDPISGWNWLRSSGHTATWTFAPDALATARRGSIHLNLSALVTNKASGGSGFSATVKLLVTAPGIPPLTRTVFLKNPFKPVDPDDSAGVGYTAYGASASILTLARATGPITVTMSWPHVTRRAHVAVKQDALSFGYRTP